MISPRHCPHCQKRIPFKKRLRARCPFCFRPFRRRSGRQDRTLIGLWLEDRSTAFWYFIFLSVFVIVALVIQAFGNADLLNFIDRRPIWFLLSIFWIALFAGIIGRIYVPLLLGAPKILRRERAVIRQYRQMTATGLVLGIPLALAFTGFDGWAKMFPGTVFLFFVPVCLLWAYQGMAITQDDYEDERTWSFLHEIGVPDRLEHRHNSFFTMIGLPLAGLLYYYFMTHPWLAKAIQRSEASGLIAMLRQIWQRTTGRM
jgi:hypothetical protein